VIVVGAGPGGCSTAFFLKHLKEDLDVLLLDRLDERKHRVYHRMCGEGISARAFSELAPLTPEPYANRIKRAVEYWPGAPPLEMPANGYIIDRPAFLCGIIESFRKKGGTVEEEAVSKITKQGDEFALECASGQSYTTRFLVGADGANSLVRRSLFPGEPKVLIWADQYIIDRPTDRETMNFHYDERYQGGYRWEFPAGDQTRIGFPRGTDAEPEGVVETHRRVIPIGQVEQIVAGNACLVGDAAGQANPLTFGGIRTALTAGKFAARAMVATGLSAYGRAWKRSRLASPSFMSAYDLIASLNNAQLADSASSFSSKHMNLSYVRSYLTKPKYRIMYSAYRRSEKHGW
jgi:digeranylgeranylglycerophospholipid reductase